MRLIVAFRVFFSVLFNRKRAEQIRLLMSSPPGEAGIAVAGESSASRSTVSAVSTVESDENQINLHSSAKNVAPRKELGREIASGIGRKRSDAITLLSTLQREARFIDLVQESLEQYSDAQIGAAARDVLRDSKKCLNRLFDIQPLVDSVEGDSISVPENASPVFWKIVGSNATNGTLAHPGWKATKVELPMWSGKSDESLVIAAAEVET